MVSIGGNGSEEGGSESDGGPAFGKDKQKALIIGKDMVEGIDPTTQDEMQKKKERIIMQSLRRKQQVRPRICCFFEKLSVNYFTFSALYSADKFSNEQKILGISL